MPSLKYLGEALFFLGVAYSVAKWTMRNAREAVSPTEGAGGEELELPEMLPALVARGVAPADEIARLSPRERVAMYRAVFDAEEGGEGRMRGVASWGAACRGCGAPLGAGTMPLGYLSHCPRCDTPLGA